VQAESEQEWQVPAVTAALEPGWLAPALEYLWVAARPLGQAQDSEQGLPAVQDPSLPDWLPLSAGWFRCLVP